MINPGTLAAASIVAVVGHFFHITEESLGYALPPREGDRRLRGIAKSKYPMVLYKDPDATGLPRVSAIFGLLFAGVRLPPLVTTVRALRAG